MNNKQKPIQSVQRAIDILNFVGNSPGEVSLKEISNHLEININTVRGLANTLIDNRFLARNINTNKYLLGLEFLSKSQQVYQSHISNIRNIAYPVMREVAEKYGVSCWLQVSFYIDIYTVETVMASNCHYLYTPKSGAHLPLHATASGKLLLAFMPYENMTKLIDNMTLTKFTDYTIIDKDKLYNTIERVKKAGYSTEFEETDLSISSVAFPFWDANKIMVGTLSVTAPSPTIDNIYKKVVIDLKKAAEKVTDEITAK